MQLQELSLRGNPLVVRFVKDMTYDPPSLLELAGRTVKTRNLCYSEQDLPADLVRYLDLASKCPNPKCGGETEPDTETRDEERYQHTPNRGST